MADTKSRSLSRRDRIILLCMFVVVLVAIAVYAQRASYESGANSRAFLTAQPSIIMTSLAQTPTK